ncbi:MAG: type III pantothenate kinase [Bacteroidaceae bacterium]|nr:type III pantothenate kinase [Bacteroidaceae bacterium]
MKTIILDVGNTFVKATLFNGDTVEKSEHFRHSDIPLFQHFLEEHPADRGAYAVVGHISGALQKVINGSKTKLHLITVSDIPETVIENRYSTPHTLGIDRIAAIIGAKSLSPGEENIMVIDVGTCITLDLTVGNAYLGGNISPGINMRLRAMHAYTKSLPKVFAEGDVPELGTSTETAMRSGVLRGVSYEIEGTISYFQKKFSNLKVYLTGGGAKELHISNNIRTFADDFLVERGINEILNNLH